MSAGCVRARSTCRVSSGFGAACEIAGQEMPEEALRLLPFARPAAGWSCSSASTKSTSTAIRPSACRGNLNVSFAYVEGESLLMGVNDIAVSSRAPPAPRPRWSLSYVIRALGIDEELAHSSIRFGLGRFNTLEEVDYVTDRVIDEVQAAARNVAAVRDGERRNRSQ